MTIDLANTPILETDRLILRAPKGADWPLWSNFAQSQRAQYIGGPFTPRTAWRAFGHVIGHWAMRGYGLFVFTLKDSDTPLGTVGPWHPADWPETELGWTVWSTAHEGKSLVYEAALATRDFAYSTLGWTTAVSYIDAPNTRSIALAERLGATLDATATVPAVDNAKEVLVYRHPAPEIDSDGGIEAYA